MNINIFISPVIIIIIFSFIIYWLNKIENCICASKIPEKKYLKEWFAIMIIIIIILNIIIYYDNSSILGILIIIPIIIAIINIIMLIRLFIYIRKINELKCNCGYEKEQNIIYYYLIIIFSIVSFILFFIIIFGFIKTVNYYSKNSKKIKKL